MIKRKCSDKESHLGMKEKNSVFLGTEVVTISAADAKKFRSSHFENVPTNCSVLTAVSSLQHLAKDVHALVGFMATHR
jgi:hypothetical protein